MNKLFLITISLFMIASLSTAADYIIVIDPGHGGQKYTGTHEGYSLSSPNNAQTPAGTKEKDLTLELSRHIRDAVEKEAAKEKIKFQIVLTRDDDSNPDFKERTARSLSKGVPNAIVSIHFNASKNHKGLGSLAMIGGESNNTNYATDKQFATGLTMACTAAVSKYLPESKAKTPIHDGHLHGGRGSNFFYQMRLKPELKNVPKCFLEVEFIDRKDVEEKLINQRQKAFPEIAASIAAYLVSYVKSSH